MITIERRHVDAIHGAQQVSDLYPAVQAAVELEHSTIPPYLTALFSLKQGRNVEVAGIIESVVIEEMLHMTIACNLLNAIGGSPSISNPRFITSYPGPLPMGVHRSLTVGLAKATRALVHDVFMAIEEPEQPIDLPDGRPRPMAEAPVAQPEFATIGQFYAAIAAKLAELDAPPGSVFPDPPRRQVTSTTWYPESQLFPIRDLDSARRAIAVIVDQGEGTASSPFDGDEPAHYYRFGEIVHGRRIVRIDSDPGWAYAGAPVGLDPAGVWDLVTDAKAADYPVGSRPRVLVDMFNAAYSRLLAGLHTAFNGEPEHLDMALSIMVEMRLTAQKLVATPVPGTTRYAAPTFEWVDASSL
jgi:hypothetical protein